MEQSFVRFLHICLNKLVVEHGLQKKAELNDGQSYMIEYSSRNFVIKIEKYYQEFYVLLYKVNKPDYAINLFNLLEYLKQDEANIPRSEYFRKEKMIDERYRKQLNYLSEMIYMNYSLIDDFFNGDSYDFKIKELEEYWKKKHPELYKGT